MPAHKIDMHRRIQTHVLVDAVTGCWNWQGNKTKTGYGKMTLRINTKRCYSTAHREAYKLYKAPIPPDKMVLHLCDNASCCNPDHLYLGSNSDNQRDRYRRSKRFNRDPITGKFTHGV